MGDDEKSPPRVKARSSAFELLLGRVYIELWELQDQPALFTKRVETFVSVFLPTMFQERLMKKNPHLKKKMLAMAARVDVLEDSKVEMDALTESVVDSDVIPAEEAEFAGEVWHATVDVLTEAGFNFPIMQPSSGFNLSKMLDGKG